MTAATKQPITWIYLATIPLIAFTTRLEVGVYSAIILVIVVLLTKLIQAGLKNHVSKDVRPYLYLLVVALQISIIQLVSKTFVPFYNDEIALYLSLMMVNVILILPEEVESSWKSLIMNLIYSSLLLIIVGLFREILGTTMITIDTLNVSVSLFSSTYAITFLQTIPGGLLIAGTILAIYGWLFNVKTSKEVEQ